MTFDFTTAASITGQDRQARDVHHSLFSSDRENVEVTLSGFNSKPNIPSRAVFWQDGIGGEILLSLSADEMDELAAAWIAARAAQAKRAA